MIPPADAYSLIDRFEFGTNGLCILVQSRTTGTKTVLKTVEGRRCRDGKYEQPEEAVIPIIKLGSTHPTIVKTFSSTDHHPDIIRSFFESNVERLTGLYTIEMEYCSGGDLEAVINRYKNRNAVSLEMCYVPEIFVLHVMISLIDALLWLHHRLSYSNSNAFYSQDLGQNYETILHADIKPANVFLRWDNAVFGQMNMPDVVLGDFGLSCAKEDSYSYCGTCDYFPPECVLAAQREELGEGTEDLLPIMTAKSDMWTFAATVHELGTLEEPRYMCTPTTALPAFYQSRLVNDIMTACLQEQKADRPSAMSLMWEVTELQQTRQALFESEGPCPGSVFEAVDDEVLSDWVSVSNGEEDYPDDEDTVDDRESDHCVEETTR